MTPDLSALREEILSGRHSAADARAQAASCADLQRRSGALLLRLGGLAVSVKALFDVQGEVTAAVAKVLAGGPPAEADSVAVASLREAAAALTGHSR